MADRIIKPDSGNVLELQDAGGTARIEINDGGTTLLKDEGGSTAMSISAAGDVSFLEDIVMGDSKYIGSSSGPTAIQIDASGNVKLSVGNLIIGTGGKGVDFSQAQTPAAGMTAEILDSYEIGTWTPTHSVFGFSSATGHYTKIGNLVTFSARVIFNNTASTGAVWGGLPFNEGLGGLECGGNATWMSLDINTGTTLYPRITDSGSTFSFYASADNAVWNNTLTSASSDQLAFYGFYYT